MENYDRYSCGKSHYFEGKPIFLCRIFGARQKMSGNRNSQGKYRPYFPVRTAMHAWFPAGRLSGSKNRQNLLSKNFEDLCVVSWYTFNDCFRLPEWVNSSKLLMPTLKNLLLAEYPKVKGWNLPIIQENADSVKWWWLLFCLFLTLHACLELHAALAACNSKLHAHCKHTGAVQNQHQDKHKFVTTASCQISAAKGWFGLHSCSRIKTIGENYYNSPVPNYESVY